MNYAEALRRLSAGELDGLETVLEEIARDAVANADLADAARALRVRIAALHGEKTPGVFSPTDTAGGALLALQLARFRVRRGGDVEVPAVEHPELALIARTIEAEALLARDEARAALDAATRAAGDARDLGYGVAEWEALHVACDAALGTRDLAKLATRLAAGSPRFASEARFFLEHDDPAALEALAGSSAIAPIAARRAQALLGHPAPLDAIDRHALQSIDAPKIEDVLVPPGEWEPGWGLDERTKSVWLPDGSRVELKKLPLLWKLIAAIADHIAASKELLVREVWNESEYHPLRHDNRLHASIKKLRKLVGEDRILTEEDGYSLAPPVRRRR